MDGNRRPSLTLTAGVTKSRHDSGTFDQETRRKSSIRIDIRYITSDWLFPLWEREAAANNDIFGSIFQFHQQTNQRSDMLLFRNRLCCQHRRDGHHLRERNESGLQGDIRGVGTPLAKTGAYVILVRSSVTPPGAVPPVANFLTGWMETKHPPEVTLTESKAVDNFYPIRFLQSMQWPGVSFAFRLFPNEGGVNFASWMAFTVPVMLINCFIAWIWLQILYMGLLR